MTTEGLLPCPAGHTKSRRTNNNIYGSWWVMCADGECSWRTAGDTEAEAIAAWNQRPSTGAGAEARGFVRGEPVKYEPDNPGHDPKYQLQLLSNGICRAAALLTKDARGDQTMTMPEWVLREWNGRVTLIAQYLAALADRGTEG